MSNIERGGCRFSAKKISDGQVHIQMELYHKTVPSLESVSLSFEVLRGISLEQARELAEKMNDQILGVVVTHMKE